MRTLANLMILSMLCVMLLGGCSQATQKPTDEAINPGEKIGAFLIKTGDQAALNDENLKCSKQGQEEKYVCEIAVGDEINASLGIYDDQYTGKLDEIWSKHTYQMTINGRPVNLQAFGSIDRQHPTVGMMRYWNVVIKADKPGEITVHSKSVVHDEQFEDTTTYKFIAP